MDEREKTELERHVDCGKFIRNKRLIAGWPSLRELARTLDISASYLSDIELGKRGMSDNMMLKIAVKLEAAGGLNDPAPSIYGSLLVLSGKIRAERTALLDLYHHYRLIWDTTSKGMSMKASVRNALWRYDLGVWEHADRWFKNLSA